jgi:hypothetical protein
MNFHSYFNISEDEETKHRKGQKGNKKNNTHRVNKNKEERGNI